MPAVSDSLNQGSETEEHTERRYVALASLARRVVAARDWNELVTATGQSLGECEPAEVRLWAMTADGIREAASSPEQIEAAAPSSLVLGRAASAAEPAELEDGGALIGLQADGVTFGVLEVHGRFDYQVLEAAAPMLANRLGVLAGQGAGDLQLSPAVIEDAGDASNVIGDFARQAKRLLDHDRLSVYLLTYDGRAFERFAVATSPIAPGEGILIPFEDVGLRHIILTNQALLSSDLGADPRLVGPEDRVVAAAGFRGLLSVPLRHNGRPFGVLNFVSRKAGFYRQDDLPIAQQIADQIAAFVQHLSHQRRAQTFVRQEASERERTRLVRDLYQAVAEAVAEISTTALEIEDGATDGKARAARIREIAESGLAEMRRAIVDLDPPELERGGLAEKAEQAMERFREQTGCDAALQVDGDPSAVGAEVARTAYRVLQEALMNTRRHADAKSVRVELSVKGDLVLSIEDDGGGFDVREALAGEGLGLRQMREGTELVGGFLKLQSKPRSGTSIRLTIPAVADPSRPGVSPPVDGAGANGSTEATLRVFVAESNSLLRAGLCHLVEGDERLRVVGETGSADQLLGHVRQLHPDVILLNSSLTEGEATALVSEIQAGSPSSAILVVSHGDVGRDAELIESGAGGVVPVAIAEQGLIQAIHSVACGTRVIGGDLEGAEASQTLTPRERSVLTLVAEGQTNAQIGSNLYLATKTVERQVTTIVRKLNARNRAHAAAIAVARRIIKLPGEFH